MLVVVGGIALGAAIAGYLLAANGTCCTVVAQGVRSKFPASLQAVGDVVNIWPATIALANLGLWSQPS